MIIEMEDYMLHVYANEVTDWFVAESADEASKLCREWNEYNGSGLNDEEMGLDFDQCPDNQTLKILHDDDQSKSESKTCQEWANLRGKGFLCSENF